MKVCGLIAEFNPLHNGHIYLINEIKNKLNPDIIILLLTGNYSMRGDISPLNKFDKVDIALDYVDLVIEFPIIYSLQNSNIFCDNAIKILNNLNINYLAFGSESNDINYLNDLLNVYNSKNYNDNVKDLLKLGYSYSKASITSLGTNINSNDILNLFYLKSIKDNNFNIKLFPIKRIKNNYNDQFLNNSLIQSATILRNLNNISNYVPNKINDYFNQYKFNTINNYYNLIQYKSLLNNLDNIHLVKEGINNLIKKYINLDYNNFINKVVNKRYNKTYINRLLINILLDYQKDLYNNQDIKYLRLLGSNNKGLNYLNSIKKDFSIPFYTKIKDNLNAILDFEIKSNKIYNLNSFKKYNEFLFPIIKKNN